jgi:3-oxoacyl-[acyl-carrier protein] reductase
MDIRLTGRSAVITGGSKGLGLAMATEFAASGADVAILARSPDTLEQARETIAKTAKGRVAAFACDVSKADQITAAFAQVMGALGKVDIVVNNAGISRAMPFVKITDAMWEDDFELKLFGAIRLTRLAWPQMTERGWGRVINVLNIGAKAPRANGAPTAVTRAAGMALTKVLAGQIVSDQWVRRHAAAGANEPFEDYIKGLATEIPLGRLGYAEEFAATACFLCSDQAGYITGTAINVDGGRSPVV